MKREEKGGGEETSKWGCNWLPWSKPTSQRTQSWKLMFATCISQQPEHAEITEGTLKDNFRQGCITIHMQPETPPLLGLMMSVYCAKQKSSAREKGRKGSRIGQEWAALTMSMVPRAQSYPWLYTSKNTCNTDLDVKIVEVTIFLKILSIKRNVLFWALLKHNAMQDKAN